MTEEELSVNVRDFIYLSLALSSPFKAQWLVYIPPA